MRDLSCFREHRKSLENFDHPFNDEVIRSLEGLQKELTGLYSQRQFKMLTSCSDAEQESG